MDNIQVTKIEKTEKGKCEYCGKTFAKMKYWQKFCSKSHRQLAWFKDNYERKKQ